jgi:hypothetical protein
MQTVFTLHGTHQCRSDQHYTVSDKVLLCTTATQAMNNQLPVGSAAVDGVSVGSSL